MATRAEIRTYLIAEFGAVEVEHGQFALELETSDEMIRSHVVHIFMTAVQNNMMMLIQAPYAHVNEISAEAAFEFSKDSIFGTVIKDDKYTLVTTLFYDSLDITTIAAYIAVFAKEADEIENNLGLGDNY